MSKIKKLTGTFLLLLNFTILSSQTDDICTPLDYLIAEKDVLIMQAEKKFSELYWTRTELFWEKGNFLIDWENPEIYSKTQTYNSVKSSLNEINTTLDYISYYSKIHTYLIFAKSIVSSSYEEAKLNNLINCYSNKLLGNLPVSNGEKYCLLVVFKISIKNKCGFVIKIVNTANLNSYKKQFRYLERQLPTFQTDNNLPINSLVAISQGLRDELSEDDPNLPVNEKIKKCNDYLSQKDKNDLVSSASKYIAESPGDFFIDHAKIMDEKTEFLFEEKFQILDKEAQKHFYVVTLEINKLFTDKKEVNELARDIFFNANLTQTNSILIVIATFKQQATITHPGTQSAFNISYFGIYTDLMNSSKITQGFPYLKKRSYYSTPDVANSFKYVMEAFIRTPKPLYRYFFYFEIDGSIRYGLHIEEEATNSLNIYEIDAYYDSNIEVLPGIFDVRKFSLDNLDKRKETYRKFLQDKGWSENKKKKYKNLPDVLQANQFLTLYTLHESEIPEHSFEQVLYCVNNNSSFSTFNAIRRLINVYKDSQIGKQTNLYYSTLDMQTIGLIITGLGMAFGQVEIGFVTVGGLISVSGDIFSYVYSISKDDYEGANSALTGLIVDGITCINLKYESKFVCSDIIEGVGEFGKYNGVVTDGILTRLGPKLKSSLKEPEFKTLSKTLENREIVLFENTKAIIQSPQEFLKETGNNLYDIVINEKYYVKYDIHDGRILLGDVDGNFYAFAQSKVKLIPPVDNPDLFIKNNIIIEAEKLKTLAGLSGDESIVVLEHTYKLDKDVVNTAIGRCEQIDALKEYFGDFKNLNLGETKGGLNVLNMPDPYFLDVKDFWVNYNSKWIERAIARKDNIFITTDVIRDNLINQYGKPSIFAYELNRLIKADLKPANLTSKGWNDAKKVIKELFEEFTPEIPL